MEKHARNRMLVLGRIAGLYGVQGWVKIFSETDPRENILDYSPWFLGGSRRPRGLAEGRPQGKGLVAKLQDCYDRDQAAALVGQEIAVRREQLPLTRTDEFYWADLEGLRVESLSGTLLGRVDHLFATAANDVMVVEGDRERLVPFLWSQVIRDVDLDQGRILVDWDPDF
jgi:16S rRNA processing protein RimM